MRAGKLDRVIKIKTTSFVDDGFGGQIPQTAVRATMRAQIIEESTDEYLRNYGTSTEQLRVFRTRYIDGVTLGDTVEYDGADYDLEQIKEIGRRRGLELRTKRVN